MRLRGLNKLFKMFFKYLFIIIYTLHSSKMQFRTKTIDISSKKNHFDPKQNNTRQNKKIITRVRVIIYR